MPQSPTEMAADLVAKLIKTNQIAPDEMQRKLREIHASLLNLDTQAASGADGEKDAGALRAKDWKKSIRKHTVACLVCGQTFKQLSARHLSQHDLDPRTYRKQFGIPANQPLAAKATTAMRRRVVREVRPWEQSPQYRKAQEKQEEPAPRPAAHARGRKKAATAT